MSKWAYIPGHNNKYKISDRGVVYNSKTGKRLLPWVQQVDIPYLRIKLVGPQGRKAHLVHCLVAYTFLGPRPVGAQVDHIDGDSLNNKASNLQYITERANMEKRNMPSRLKGKAEAADKVSRVPAIRTDQVRKNSFTMEKAVSMLRGLLAFITGTPTPRPGNGRKT
jgi:hypothetical protein